MTMDRRTFTKSIPLAMGAAAIAGAARGVGATAGGPGATQASGVALPKDAGMRPFHIGMFVFPGMTNLDFVGTHGIISRPPSARIHILGKTLDPVPDDAGNRILADTLFTAAPELDMLFVGGGPGTEQMMQDREILAFFRDRAPRARYITSVCTGALVLGAAGLLRGYRAATHWTTMDILPMLGAIPVHERVVIDRDRITGGGVTAGIDFGLAVVDQLWGREMAETIQLANEYDPHPPFNAGSPLTAPARSVEMVRAMVHDGVAAMTSAAARAARGFA